MLSLPTLFQICHSERTIPMKYTRRSLRCTRVWCFYFSDRLWKDLLGVSRVVLVARIWPRSTKQKQLQYLHLVWLGALLQLVLFLQRQVGIECCHEILSLTKTYDVKSENLTVCHSVCSSVRFSATAGGNFNLVCRYIFTISRLNLSILVIGSKWKSRTNE